MDKRQIEMVLAINNFGNITKAADYIGITQPTLSKFLSKTESKYGVKIFYRYAKSIKPTEEGIVLLETFRNILNQLNEADRKISELRDGNIQELSIATHQVLGKFILPKLEKGIQKNKGVSLNYTFMNSRKVTEEVVNGNIDLGIVVDPQKYPDLVIRPLWKEFIGLYSKDGKIKDIVLYNSNMIFVNKTLNKLEFKRKKKVDDYTIIYSILKRTATMGLLPNPIAESEDKLKLIKRFQPNIDICLIYNSNRLKTKGMADVISLIRECSRT